MGKRLSVYIHIPFCKSRCHYCDFMSTVDISLAGKYFEAVESEVLGLKKLLQGEYELCTVYIGGGTPSFVKTKLFQRVLEALFAEFEVGCDLEFTVECNPDSLNEDFLKFFTGFGMNRISIGVQSVSDEILKAVNRPHDIGELMKKYELARKYLSNINFDFIIGLPGFGADTLQSTVTLLEKTAPEHVSFYILELHEKTELYRMYDRDMIDLPPVDINIENLEKISYELARLGYVRYEISNFARRGFESRHNLAYWDSGEYAGIGASAGGHLENLRYVNTSDVLKYIEYAGNASGYDYCNLNEARKELVEYFFMGLRKTEGISVSKTESRFGSNLVSRFMERLAGREEILIEGDTLRIKNFYLTRNTGIFEFISRM